MPRYTALLGRFRTAFAQGDLPGRKAQALMAPPGRGEFPEPPANARVASVLALLYPIGDELHLLFIQRTSPPNDHHAGQISFPGGSADPGDSDALDTALREAEEEVGLVRDSVEVLGALTPLYIPVSNFIVDPFIACAVAGPKFRLQESEVERVLTVPFNDFLQPGARKVGDRLLTSGIIMKQVPYWGVAGEEIWGATSMIVAEMVKLIR